MSTASFGNCTPEVFAELFPSAMGKAQCTVLPIHLGIDDLSRVRIRVVRHNVLLTSLCLKRVCFVWRAELPGVNHGVACKGKVSLACFVLERLCVRTGYAIWRLAPAHGASHSEVCKWHNQPVRQVWHDCLVNESKKRRTMRPLMGSSFPCFVLQQADRPGLQALNPEQSALSQLFQP